MFLRTASKLVTLPLLVALLACGGGGGNAPAPTGGGAAVVTVTAPTTQVTLAPQATAQLQATVSGSTNTALTWTTTGGLIDGRGFYTAPAAEGTYRVVATSVADPAKSATITITVTAAPMVAVTVNPTSASLATNATQTFTATVTGAANTDVTWSATGGSVTSGGFYTAPATAGSYTVTATSVADPTKKASATVTVTAPAPTVSVSVNPTSSSLATNATQTFTSVVSGAANTAVTWSATGGSVTSGGFYTAPATAGSYTVTATSVADPSKKASATVTVTAPAPTVSVSVNPTSSSLATNATQTFTAVVTGSANTAVTWTATGGSITSGGVYTAPATAGSYTVTAASVADPSKKASATVTATAPAPGGSQLANKPEGLYATPGVAVPYAHTYDAQGREKLPNGLNRRVIGYFTSWRDGQNGQAMYLASHIPWSKLTHVNYAFASVDASNRISIGDITDPKNPAVGLTWPGVAGAEMDPSLPYHGHFNLLNRYKKLYGVRTLVSVGGWTGTGGYYDAQGNRVPSGGFYTMTVNADGTVNQAGIDTFSASVVTFLRTYGFDGVDVDFEYPTSMTGAGNPDDAAVAEPRRASLNKGYRALMKTLRERLDQAAAVDGRYYLISAATPASGWLLRGMETFQSTQYLDFVNMMSYDYHGAWNAYVGPNAALYDGGNDAELAASGIYGNAQYGSLGYLNGDWAYHYFRGSMPSGRINLGIPYYSRGWKGVTGGTQGLWGRSSQGATGIDNLWHDKDANGQELGGGSNPMWHAKNLQQGLPGSYVAAYGLPAVPLTGTYTHQHDGTMVASWLWNASKQVFLSTEDEQSAAAKADYVVAKGLGGILIWELAGDYDWDATRNGGQGEYYIGATLTRLFASKFTGASGYGNQLTTAALPAQAVQVTVEVGGFPVGDQNYPINPKLTVTNRTQSTLPGGSVLEFDLPTSTSATVGNWSGDTVTVTAGHTGPNVGGLKGDFHRVAVTLPTWLNLAPGASYDISLVYYLPVSGPMNYTLKVGTTRYALSQERPGLPVVNP